MKRLSSSQTNSTFAIARYQADGLLDAAFANACKLTLDFFGFTDLAESVSIDQDGKIAVGGLARDHVDGYGVMRINP